MHDRVPDLHGAVLFPGHGPVVPAAQTQVESRLSAMPLQSLSLVDEQSRGRGVHVHTPALQVGVAPEQAAPVASWPAAVQVWGALLRQLTGPGVPTQARALVVVHA